MQKQLGPDSGEMTRRYQSRRDRVAGELDQSRMVVVHKTEGMPSAVPSPTRFPQLARPAT